MIRHLLLALALAAGVSSAAQAQTADVVQVCGATSGVVSPLGPGGRLTRDINGGLCVSGVSGGGGGSGGTVTQGTSPWVVSGNTQSNSSGNPIFTQVTNFPATQPVSGSVSVSNFPASQVVTNGGTFAVQNTAAIVGGNTTAVKTDGSGVTQPISASALPLPAGAATAANQSSEISALGAPGDAGYGGSGNASIISALKGVYAAQINASVPPGTNSIGTVGLNAGSNLVGRVSSGVTPTEFSGTLSAAAGAQVLGADATRQFLGITNTGSNPLSYRWGTTGPTATVGHIIAPGATQVFDAKVPTSAMTAFSTNGTTYTITVGN